MLQTATTFKALGLMSGSSLDGLDLAFCEMTFAESGDLNTWNLVAAETLPFSEPWKKTLAGLPAGSALQLAEAHAAFGEYVGELVNVFLEKHQLTPNFIASHGHTIFHYPDKRFTTQIGDGAAIAARTRRVVIDNFRAQDVALGGQGAPLAPLADRVLFSDYDFCLNLGGIANLTLKADGGRYVAYDIGGANQVLNALVQPVGLAYDDKGMMAARGSLNAPLKAKADALPFFSLPYPKSLGNDWVRRELIPLFLVADCPLEDKLYTACVQLAEQIAAHIAQTLEREGVRRSNYKLLATGGGAMNDFLMDCIRKSCASQNVEVVVPDSRIISFKEAILMALLGALRMLGKPNCMASVTGAERDAVGGAVHLGKEVNG
ncbi:MAG: anhydro-N-acetylmuramic acid kinase [Saprospiraceae bacterium]|nr:anhydro-N-acetylmuramic acid kinase [Saprospiraceae bacterium]MDZ4705576.1 anhydro-N-acetylmuramic acid kinase [Saprospiraceae bacterium]